MPSHYGLPLTIDMHERSRMQESARRRRLLDGVWEADLVETMSQYVAPEQMAAWGRPDLTKNVFRSVVSQLSILYDREPIIEHDDPVAAERMRELCRGAGVWTHGPQLQRLVIGQREALRRCPGRMTRCSCAWCPSTPSRPQARRTRRAGGTPSSSTAPRARWRASHPRHPVGRGRCQLTASRAATTTSPRRS